MSSRILDLSHELILQIAKILLDENRSVANNDGEELPTTQKIENEGADADVNPRENGQDDDPQGDRTHEQEDERKPCRLGSSSKEAIINLSRACTSFYKILSPYLFRSITIRNSVKSSGAVQRLCSNNQSIHVKTLHFKASTQREDEEVFRDVEGIFPPGLDAILGGLSQFPNLETLVIDFHFHVAGDAEFERYEIGLNDEFETEEEIANLEEQEGWRALVKKTFNALSVNTSDTVQKLVVKDCPISRNTVLGSERLNKWLNKLECFEFDIYGADNGGMWALTPTGGFQNYIKSLDRYYLDALTNITRLAIIGDAKAVLGEDGYHDVLVPLRPEHAPKLKELELGYYFVQGDLLDFLKSHSSSLEHLIFNHCYFSDCNLDYSSDEMADEVDNGTHLVWNTWLHEYASQNPRALHRVTFIPYNANTLEQCNTPDNDETTDFKEFLKKRKAEGREYRVFPYGEVFDKYGDLEEREECNENRARKGRDLEGWYELVEVMKSNREWLRE